MRTVLAVVLVAAGCTGIPGVEGPRDASTAETPDAAFVGTGLALGTVCITSGSRAEQCFTEGLDVRFADGLLMRNYSGAITNTDWCSNPETFGIDLGFRREDGKAVPASGGSMQHSVDRCLGFNIEDPEGAVHSHDGGVYEFDVRFTRADRPQLLDCDSMQDTDACGELHRANLPRVRGHVLRTR